MPSFLRRAGQSASSPIGSLPMVFPIVCPGLRTSLGYCGPGLRSPHSPPPTLLSFNHPGAGARWWGLFLIVVRYAVGSIKVVVDGDVSGANGSPISNCGCKGFRSQTKKTIRSPTAFAACLPPSLPAVDQKSPGMGWVTNGKKYIESESFRSATQFARIFFQSVF